MQQSSQWITLNTRNRLAINFIATLLFTLSGCGSSSPAANPSQRPMMPPPHIAVQSAHAQNVPVEVNYTATAEALNTVEVAATANGLLLNRYYTEGQFVEQGMVLFKINPEKYDAKEQEKKAELAEKQAVLRQAKRDWDRIFKLRKEGAVSQNERDQAVSALEIAEANVALAQAELNDAALDVGYTNVKAPISGITGMENYSIGNIIVGGTSLTTITQLDPIYVKFSVPEAEFNSVLKPYLQNMSPEAKPAVDTLQLEIIFSDNRHYGSKGRINYYDKVVNPETDTLQFRALFPNPEQQLLPGQFVRIVISGLQVTAGFILPSKAVIQGKTGPAVYTVNQAKLAQLTPVTLSLQTPSQQMQDSVIITQGLNEGDRVIVDGVIKVMPGQPVEAIDAAEDLSAKATQYSEQAPKSEKAP